MSSLGRAFAAAQERFDSAAPLEVPEAEDLCTSLQPLGDAEVLVLYGAPFGHVSIAGAYVGAEFVEADEFARRRLDAWQWHIQQELDADRADTAECARLQDELDRDLDADACAALNRWERAA